MRHEWKETRQLTVWRRNWFDENTIRVGDDTTEVLLQFQACKEWRRRWLRKRVSFIDNRRVWTAFHGRRWWWRWRTWMTSIFLQRIPCRNCHLNLLSHDDAHSQWWYSRHWRKEGWRRWKQMEFHKTSSGLSGTKTRLCENGSSVSHVLMFSHNVLSQVKGIWRQYQTREEVDAKSIKRNKDLNINKLLMRKWRRQRKEESGISETVREDLSLQETRKLASTSQVVVAPKRRVSSFSSLVWSILFEDDDDDEEKVLQRLLPDVLRDLVWSEVLDSSCLDLVCLRILRKKESSRRWILGKGSGRQTHSLLPKSLR